MQAAQTHYRRALWKDTLVWELSVCVLLCRDSGLGGTVNSLQILHAEIQFASSHMHRVLFFFNVSDIFSAWLSYTFIIYIVISILLISLSYMYIEREITWWITVYKVYKCNSFLFCLSYHLLYNHSEKKEKHRISRKIHFFLCLSAHWMILSQELV